jgi:hypothetical protein
VDGTSWAGRTLGGLESLRYGAEKEGFGGPSRDAEMKAFGFVSKVCIRYALVTQKTTCKHRGLKEVFMSFLCQKGRMGMIRHKKGSVAEFVGNTGEIGGLTAGRRG